MLLTVLIFVFSLIAVIKVKNYVIIAFFLIWIPLQNFLLPFLYTTFGISQGIILPLILAKEVLLLVFLIYLIITNKSRVMPTSIKLCFIILVYILFYTLISITIFEMDFSTFRQLRSLIFPFEVLLVGYFAAINLKELKLLFKITILMALITSIYGIMEVFFLDSSFFLRFINIAEYNYYIKGDDRVIFSEGIAGSSQGRGFSDRRLGSTYGDPLSFGMASSFALLLILIHTILSKKINLMIHLIIVAIAILLTFSRSSWLLLGTGLTYLSVRYSKYLHVYILLWVAFIALFISEDLRTFILDSILLKSDIEHQEGFMEFYKHYLIDPSYFFGHGIREIDWVIESGYLFIFYQLGFIGLVMYILFFISVFNDLKIKKINHEYVVVIISIKLMIIGTFVVTNFSHYALTFNHYFTTWVFAGICLKIWIDNETSKIRR
jgi:hypothetical protein